MCVCSVCVCVCVCLSFMGKSFFKPWNFWGTPLHTPLSTYIHTYIYIRLYIHLLPFPSLVCVCGRACLRTRLRCVELWCNIPLLILKVNLLPYLPTYLPMWSVMTTQEPFHVIEHLTTCCLLDFWYSLKSITSNLSHVGLLPRQVNKQVFAYEYPSKFPQPIIMIKGHGRNHH